MAAYTNGLFLLADTQDELHKIAESIGLRRRDFIDSRYQYYELYSDTQAEAAIAAGAKFVELREIVQMYSFLAVYNTRALREHVIYCTKGISPVKRKNRGFIHRLKKSYPFISKNKFTVCFFFLILLSVLLSSNKTYSIISSIGLILAKFNDRSQYLLFLKTLDPDTRLYMTQFTQIKYFYIFPLWIMNFVVLGWFFIICNAIYRYTKN